MIIERNTRLIALTLAFLLWCGLSLGVLLYQRTTVEKMAMHTAEQAMSQAMAVRSYFAEHTGFVPGSSADMCTRIAFGDGGPHVPSYAVKSIDFYYRNASGSVYLMREIARDARNVKNEVQEHEIDLFDRFIDDPTRETYTDFRLIEGKRWLVHVRRGQTFEEKCLACHGKPADAPVEMINLYGAKRGFYRQVGSLASLSTVQVPLDADYVAADRKAKVLAAIIGAVLALFTSLHLWVMHARLFVPLKKIYLRITQKGAKQLPQLEDPLDFGRESELQDIARGIERREKLALENQERLVAIAESRAEELDTVKRRFHEATIQNAQIEQELRKQLYRFESVLEHQDDMVCRILQNGVITYCNPSVASFFHIPVVRLTGSRIQTLFQPSDWEQISQFLESGEGMDTAFVQKKEFGDGTVRYVEWRLTDITEDNDDVREFALVGRECTERVRAYEQMVKGREETGLILKKTHHRMKGDLQMISGMLSLQMQGCTDRNALALLRESDNRVRVIMLAHERMHRLTNPVDDRMRMLEYLEDIVEHLSDRYTVAGDQYVISINAENVVMTIEEAVPVGMMVNELVTNALHHAFADRFGGTITISLKDNTDRYTLVVSDDGVGIDPDISLEDGGMGFRVIRALLDQWDGTVTFSGGNGTTVTLVWRKPRVF